MSLAQNEESLMKLFSGLKPEQCLVKLLFDEVKLKESLLFTGGHTFGRAQDKEDPAKYVLHFKTFSNPKKKRSSSF